MREERLEWEVETRAMARDTVEADTTEVRGVAKAEGGHMRCQICSLSLTDPNRAQVTEVSRHPTQLNGEEDSLLYSR